MESAGSRLRKNSPNGPTILRSKIQSFSKQQQRHQMPLVKHGILLASPAVTEKTCNRFIHEGMNYKLHCPTSCRKCPTDRVSDRIALAGMHIRDHFSYTWDHEPALRRQNSFQRG